MTERNWTPEPWVVEDRYIVSSDALTSEDGNLVAQTHPMSECGDANAARIIACVNACAGIDDPEAFMAVARETIVPLKDPAEALRLAGEALAEMLRVQDALMPGVRHIAVQDYALLNDAPLKAREALAALGVKP